MKKAIAPLIVLFALMFGSLGSAQSEGFGIYSGFPTWIGIQYQAANLRFGAGLSGLGFSGSADLMIVKNPLPVSPGFELAWYAGAGASVGFYSYLGSSAIYIFPHGLAGIEYKFPEQPFSAYFEGQLGFGIYTGTLVGYGNGLDYNARIGLIFRQ